VTWSGGRLEEPHVHSFRTRLIALTTVTAFTFVGATSVQGPPDA
jgi:hypothetical protein